MKDWSLSFIEKLKYKYMEAMDNAILDEDKFFYEDVLYSLQNIVGNHYSSENDGSQFSYYSILKSDLETISYYSDCFIFISNTCQSIVDIDIQLLDLCKMNTPRVPPLILCEQFYSAVGNIYPKLYSSIKKSFNKTLSLYQVSDEQISYGNTYPIYGTGLAFLDIGFTNTIQDYFTSIHECSHAMSARLNPYILYEKGKYCFSEVDSLFFELLLGDFNGFNNDLKKECLKVLTINFKDIMYSLFLIYDKLISYENLSKSDLYNKRHILKYLKDELGYDYQGSQDIINTRIIDILPYVISYLVAIEFYFLYQENKENAINSLITFIVQKDMSLGDYFTSLDNLGISLGEHVNYFILYLERKEFELYGRNQILNLHR